MHTHRYDILLMNECTHHTPTRPHIYAAVVDQVGTFIYRIPSAQSNEVWLGLSRKTLLLPYSVPGLLEYEAIPGISNSRPIGSKRCGSHDSMITTETVTKELTSVLGMLEKNYVDPHTVGQIMKQVWGVGRK